MTNCERHSQICKELTDIYEKKNHDYGDSFHNTFTKLGIISAITRICDKYQRIEALCTKSKEDQMVKGESIEDTLIDMANYCIMTIMEIRGEKHNEV